MIKVKNLHFAYPDSEKEIISGISLQVKRGATLAIMGKNGSGKSTLLKLMAGLLKPDRGKISIQQKDDSFDLTKPGMVGFAPERPEAYFFAPTVREEVEFFPKNLGLDFKTAASEAMSRLGIYHLSHRSPFSLSAGQQRKVSIASILSGGPQIIVLDEPTQGLHKSGEREVGKILNDLDRTVILSTHHSDFTYQFADRVAFLDNGKLLSEGKVFSELCDEDVANKAGIDLPGMVKWAKRHSFNKIPRNLGEAVKLAQNHPDWAS